MNDKFDEEEYQLLKALLFKVRMMRIAQKDYFTFRTGEALQRSKKLEIDVDKRIEAINHPTYDMFGKRKEYVFDN